MGRYGHHWPCLRRSSRGQCAGLTKWDILSLFVFSGTALVGAGTVLLPEQVQDVRSAGGQLIISPNFNPCVVAETVSAGLVSLPGVFSPSEMFGALAAGATGLKVFPAEACPPSAIKAVRAVLPADVSIFVVGGIAGDNMAAYLKAGATGFGLGGTLYRAGKAPADVERDAKATIAKFKEVRQST